MGLCWDFWGRWGNKQGPDYGDEQINAVITRGGPKD